MTERRLGDEKDGKQNICRGLLSFMPASLYWDGGGSDKHYDREQIGRAHV